MAGVLLSAAGLVHVHGESHALVESIDVGELLLWVLAAIGAARVAGGLGEILRRILTWLKRGKG